MEPQVWIGTSWKMNKLLAEGRAFAEGLKAAEAARDPRIQRFLEMFEQAKNLLLGRRPLLDGLEKRLAQIVHA